MSTTSTATTLVAHDCIPGNEVELLNQMCVLVLTRGNGTPFDVTSIQEDDMTELCFEMAQTHPKGVLQFSVTELVVLFHFMDKMLIMACGVTKAMVLYKEPISLHTSPPSTAQMRAYIAVRDGWPLGIQSPTPDREEIPQPSPSNPQPDGRTLCQFQMDLGDSQLRQLMEDLCQEVALRELNVPPRYPSSGHYGTPAGDGDPMWMTRRSPS